MSATTAAFVRDIEMTVRGCRYRRIEIDAMPFAGRVALALLKLLGVKVRDLELIGGLASRDGEQRRGLSLVVEQLASAAGAQRADAARRRAGGQRAQ